MNQTEKEMIHEMAIARENIELATLEYESAKNRYYAYITSKE